MSITEEDTIDTISMNREEYDKIKMEKLHQDIEKKVTESLMKKGRFFTASFLIIASFVGWTYIEMTIDKNMMEITKEKIKPQMNIIAKNLKENNTKLKESDLLFKRINSDHNKSRIILSQITKDAINELDKIKVKSVKFQDDILTLRNDITENYTAMDAEMKKAIEIANYAVKVSKGENIKDNTEEFKKNSDYSVLLFFRSHRKLEAEQIESELISLGYKSSSTQTNLQETNYHYLKNQILVLYTIKGQEKLINISTLLKGLSEINSPYISAKEEISMKRGDIQILLF